MDLVKNLFDFPVLSELRIIHWKTKIDSLGSLEWLCVIKIYFFNSIHILQWKLPEVTIDHIEVSGLNPKLDR